MNETMTSSAALKTPDKAALRSELEQTQASYHRLLDSLSPDDWKTKSGNPAWTVGQLLYHLAWGAGFTRGGIESTRSGKGRNIPQFLINPLNVMITRFGARRATKASLEKRYDEAIAGTLAAIDGLRDEDWARTAVRFGRTESVEDVVRNPIEHFAEHLADINRGLGRA